MPWASEPAGVPGGKERPAAGRANVLLVDDHEENLLALEAVLSELGHNLVKAASGKEALKRLLDEDFAAILLDVQMPEMDGFETAALIRERERSRHTPIIFLTAFSKGETHVFKGYAAGAVDYIFKPFVPEVLRAKVSVFVDLFEMTRRVREQSELLRRLESREHRKELTLLRAQRNRFFHLSLDMMCILGFDGRLKEFNSAWETSLGFSRHELVSRDFAELVHADDRPATEAFLRRLRGEPNRTHGLEVRLLQKDGGCRWLAWNATAYGRERVLYAAGRDVTERRRSEQALLEMNGTLEQRVESRTRDLVRINQELEREVGERQRAEADLQRKARELARSNSDLEQFAYVASHDLKEPLRKVAGFAELLARRCGGLLDAEARRYVEIIVSGATRMQEMIAELMEYARVGREDRRAGPADMGRVLESALANLSGAIEESRARVEAGPMPVVRGDAAQLARLLQNLIGNAVKFHGPQAPVVEVGALRQEGAWLFWVRDNGIGIDPADHERIFAVFRRLHSRQEYPGNGIGLAICKRIVESHGGAIWVESAAGTGSKFLFTLPDGPA